jgi:hypothetical protein
VEFDVFGKIRVVSEPRVEEVGSPKYIYPFFGFGDNLTGESALDVVVFIFLVLLSIGIESERIGGFVVGVERLDEVLTLTVPSSANHKID